MFQRRKILQGMLATGSTTALALAFKTPAALADTVRPPGMDTIYLPPIDRAQGMGTTDASGFVALLPLRAQGAKQVWVDGVKGSASFNGLSPYPGYQLNGSGPNYQNGATGPGTPDANFGPIDTYANALNSVYPTVVGGEGNQFFFAEGQTFVLDQLRYGIMFYHGIGASYPVCFQSYSPQDPLNVAIHGRAGTGARGARPTWVLGTGSWPFSCRGDAVDYGGWAFRGLNWVSTGNGQVANWIYCCNNMLFENVVFNNVQLALQNVNLNPGFTTSSNNIIRFCASYGQYDVNGGHINGFYSQNVNLVVEDSVFWHCGWKVGVSRNVLTSQGGPDIYKHCLYLHNGLGTTSIVRRNVMVDASASGLSLRGNHVCHHNVMIDCPLPEAKSGGSGSDTESPNGVSQQSYCQLVIGGADISANAPRMQGSSCSDGISGSFYAFSLYVNNPGYGQVNNNWFNVQNFVPAQMTYMGFYYNCAYAFAPPTKRILLNGQNVPSAPSITVTADSENVLSVTSPMTTASLYAYAGVSDKQTLINAMIADPTQAYAYKLLYAASAGFNFNFNYNIT